MYDTELKTQFNITRRLYYPESRTIQTTGGVILICYRKLLTSFPLNFSKSSRFNFLINL